MIKIYKDIAANSIFIEDNNGAQFINSLQATVPVVKVTIRDLAKEIDIVSDVDHTDFVDQNDVQYPGTATEVCDALNAIFQSSGTPTGDSPTITSNTNINLVEGQVTCYLIIQSQSSSLDKMSVFSNNTIYQANSGKVQMVRGICSQKQMGMELCCLHSSAENLDLSLISQWMN